MDRRSFLATGATVALLPLTEAPAFAAARQGGQQGRAHEPLFEDIFQERVRNSPNSRLRSVSTRGRTQRSSRSSTPTRRRSAAQGPGPQPPRNRRAEGDQPFDLVGCGQAQPRSRPLLARDGDRRAIALEHRFRAASLSDHAAGRRLFLDARFPQHRAHDQQCRRRRSLSVAPQPVRRPCSTTTPPSSAPRRRAASSRQHGPST